MAKINKINIPEPEVINFKSQKEFRKWFTRNHTRIEGIWLRMFKKETGIKTITHAEALEEALCYGWIDGQGKKYDNESWIVKFTPRRSRSVWSKRNIAIAESLIETKRMKEPGFKQIEAAKADGRWNAAYDSPRNMEVPPDFMKALSANKKALEFFNTLNRANTYAIAWRLQTAKKPETREKRMKLLLEMMADGKKLH